MLLQELTVLFNLKRKQSKKRKNKGKKRKKENKKEKQKKKKKQKRKKIKKKISHLNVCTLFYLQHWIQPLDHVYLDT